MAQFNVTPVDATFRVQVGENTAAAALFATTAQGFRDQAEGFADDADTSANVASQARDVAIAAGVQYPSEAAAVAALVDGAFGSYLDAGGLPVYGQRTGATMTPIPGPWLGGERVDFRQSGAGAVVRTARDKLRDTVSVKDFVAADAANTVAGIQAAIDSVGGQTVTGANETYTITAPLTIGTGKRLKNFGLESTGLTTRQVLFSGLCERNEITTMSFNGNGNGRAIHAPELDAAVVHDVLIANNYAQDLAVFVELSAAGASGRITGNTVDTSSSPVVRIGSNDYNSSLNYGPMLIDFNQFRNVDHGPLTYAPNSLIVANYVQNVTDPANNAIYTKARNSVVSSNILVNGGYGQGSINMKGDPRGQTTMPEGFAITCVGNNVSYTRAWLEADPGLASGIKADSSELLVVANIMDMGDYSSTATCFAAFQTGLAQGRLNVASNLLFSPRAINSAAYLVIEGPDNIFTGNQVFAGGATPAGVRISDQTIATQINIWDNCVRGGQRGFIVNPTTASVLELSICGNDLREQTFSGVFLADGKRLKRLRLADNHFEAMSANTDFNGIVDQVYVKGNSGWRVTTTDGNPVTVVELPMARDTVSSVRVRTTASTGTDHFVQVVETSYANIGGTVTEVGTPVVIYSATFGTTAGWNSTRLVSPDRVLFRVDGTIGQTIKWTLDVEVMG